MAFCVREPVGFAAGPYHFVVTSKHLVKQLRIFNVIGPGSITDSWWTSFEQLILLDQFKIHEIVEVFTANSVVVVGLGVEEVL